MRELPDAVKCPDDYGRVALHCACENLNASLELVNCIYEAFPGAINTKNCFKQTPLHWAMEESTIAVIKFMVGKVDSSALRIKDDENDTPLNLALLNEDYNVALLLLEHHPNAAQQKDANGNLPLALACANEKFFGEVDRLEILDLLVRAYPDSISATNNEGEPALDEETKDNLMKHMASQLQEHHQSKRRKTTSNML